MIDLQEDRYNSGIKEAYLNGYQMQTIVTELKREYNWLRIPDKFALNNACRELDRAYYRFFNKKGKHPKFKSRKNSRQSYLTNCNHMKNMPPTIRFIDEKHLRLPKVGVVYCKWSSDNMKSLGRLGRVSVNRDTRGRYFVSLGYTLPDKSSVSTNTQSPSCVGIDLGLSDLAIMSDGTKYSKITYGDINAKIKYWSKVKGRRYTEAQKQIAFDKNEHPEYFRELCDFPRYQQARKTLAKYEQKRANIRRDTIQKITTKIVNNYDIIVVEKLKASNLKKVHNWGSAVSNASWYEFVRELEYKCDWYNKTIVKVSAYNTSRICSCCGTLNTDFSKISNGAWMKIRKWECPTCGAKLDRDVNASINILNRGLNSIN